MAASRAATLSGRRALSPRAESWACERWGADNVPAYKNERVVVSYTGPWSRAFDRVNGESALFNLAPNDNATETLSLKTPLIH